MAKRDYYDILGITRGASADEIKAAHRKLVRRLHPDANKSDPNATAKFQEVQEAYDVLGDSDRKVKYDQFGHAGEQPDAGYGEDPYAGQRSRSYRTASGDESMQYEDANNGQFGEIFDQLFGSGGPFGRGGGTRRTAPREEPTNDVEYPMTLTFVQAARGTNLPLQISRGGKTESIEVKIPAGVKTGSRVRIRGRGNAVGSTQGDLFIVVNVSDHPFFRREGLDVLIDVPVSLYESLLGAKVAVPTLDGDVTITVPPGTSSGTHLRIKQRGIKRGAETGDQHCIIKILLPKDLDAEDIAAVQSIQKKHPLYPRSDTKW